MRGWCDFCGINYTEENSEKGEIFVLWVTFAHETGHMVGGRHANDRGGLLDALSWNGVLNGVAQFNARENEKLMCEGLVFALKGIKNCMKVMNPTNRRRRLVNPSESPKEEEFEETFFGWETNGRFEECFPPCGKWRYRQFSSHFFLFLFCGQIFL